MTESILDGLSAADAKRVLAAGNELTLPQGWSPIAERTPADKAYLICEGEVSVRKGGVEIATLGPGAVVGETAIVNRTLRSATIVALTPLKVVHFTSGSRTRSTSVTRSPVPWRRSSSARSPA